MSNYINGYSYPQIVVKDIATNETITTINLDLCGVNGLTENYTESFRRVELLTGELITYDCRGSRIEFILDYSEYVKKNNLFNIEYIFHYASLPDTYKLLLIPRIDNLSRYFEVMLSDGTYSLGILGGGSLSKGHKLPVIKFITVNYVSKDFMDTDLNYIPLFLKSA